jgi:predicted HAD superfamily Cof-like phosphohydrolase
MENIYKSFKFTETIAKSAYEYVFNQISSAWNTNVKTNYKKVKEFHETFGMAIENEFSAPLLEDTKLVSLRLGLIDEEVAELKEAIKNKDRKEVVDALSDILYVVYGAGVSFGIDLDKAFDLVHKSNMSKVCETEEIAKETVEWYKKDGRYDSPAYKKSGDKFMVYNESTGKTLKSIHYKAVDLSEFVVN